MEVQAITSKTRIHWMDNLRTIIIMMVVLYHVGGVYEAAGLWGGFWIVDDPATITWVGIVGIFFDLFVMPAMFFVAGYLTPPSLGNKTGWGFIKSKAKRLMFPWLIAVFTLIPLYKVIFLYSRGLPQENWLSYFHFNTQTSQNWLWFLPAAFRFQPYLSGGAEVGDQVSQNFPGLDGGHFDCAQRGIQLFNRYCGRLPKLDPDPDPGF